MFEHSSNNFVEGDGLLFQLFLFIDGMYTVSNSEMCCKADF